MVITEVIGLLRNDSELSSLLNGNHVYAIPSTYLGKSIVYSYTTEQSDGIVGVDKLELQIITETHLEAAYIEKRIKKILLTIGDSPLTDTVTQVELNGGGELFDEGTQMLHKILYFYITYKE